MRDAAHALEDAIGRDTPSQLAALLMMRRAEKDFILRGKPGDAQLFRESAQALRARFRAAHSRGGPAKLEALAGEYEALFAGYVALAGQVDILTREHLEAAGALEPTIDALQSDLLRAAGAQFQVLGGSVRQTLVSGGAAALLVFAFAAWLGWVAIRRITASTREFSSFAAALARGESGTRLRISGDDDFGRLGSALDAMGESLEAKDRARRAQEEEIRSLNRGLEERVLERTRQLEEANQGLTERNGEINSLSELARVMLASRTPGEVYHALPRFMQQLLPQSSGRLYTMNASATFAESQCSWGSPRLEQEMIGHDDCWALRRGRPHVVNDIHLDMVCAHQKSPDVAPPYLCVPLTAHNEGLGLLYVEPGTTSGATGSSHLALAEAASEQLALGIASLRMRVQLRSQSIRDPLTGLYNRRYLEEAAERELHLARRKGNPLAVIMIDVDHFKKFNDAHGHEAGDEMLKAVSGLMGRTVRASDIVCRYGGEEFTVLMPEAGVEAALRSAEQLRAAARELRTGSLPPITLSLGVALFPAHGQQWDELMRAADAALYEAKRSGRDRVALAGTPVAAPAAA